MYTQKFATKYTEVTYHEMDGGFWFNISLAVSDRSSEMARLFAALYDVRLLSTLRSKCHYMVSDSLRDVYEEDGIITVMLPVENKHQGAVVFQTVKELETEFDRSLA